MPKKIIQISSPCTMPQPALQVATLLAERKIASDVIDLRTLSPLDGETIMGSVMRTKRAVVVHEAPRTCDLGAERIARINEKALLYLEAPVERVTGFDTVMPLPKLEQRYLPNAERVAAAVDRALSV